MAYPWIFESNFESGTNGEWDSESDTGSLLDFPHYSDLACIPGAPVPYRGAYCMRIVCGDTNDHTVTEGDIDIADAATRYFRWHLFAATNLTATSDDAFNIFELQQAGGTVEQSVGMQITAATNKLEIGIGDGTAPSSYVEFPRGRWVCVELTSTISTGGAGAMTLFLDGGQAITLTSLTQAAAVGRGVLGTQDTLATTTGALYFDQFVMDDARVYPLRERFPAQVPLSKSAHVFVGPGCIEGAALLSTTVGEVMRLYDTDTASSLDELSFVAELSVNGSSSISGPVQFRRGCYALLSGTAPYGEVFLVQSSHKPATFGPLYYSPGAIRQYGLKRTARSQNV
jgi:hypothetical protein